LVGGGKRRTGSCTYVCERQGRNLSSNKTARVIRLSGRSCAPVCSAVPRGAHSVYRRQSYQWRRRSGAAPELTDSSGLTLERQTNARPSRCMLSTVMGRHMSVLINHSARNAAGACIIRVLAPSEAIEQLHEIEKNDNHIFLSEWLQGRIGF
jgi:hypothetical protein